MLSIFLWDNFLAHIDDWHFLPIMVNYVIFLHDILCVNSFCDIFCVRSRGNAVQFVLDFWGELMFEIFLTRRVNSAIFLMIFCGKFLPILSTHFLGTVRLVQRSFKLTFWNLGLERFRDGLLKFSTKFGHTATSGQLAVISDAWKPESFGDDFSVFMQSEF